MRIASFTQTYGDQRSLELQLLQYDKIGNEFRNKCDLIVFSFHNCPDSFVAKSTDLLKTIYPVSKLQILTHNNIPYLQSIQQSLQYLTEKDIDYMLQIQDDQHGINTVENVQNIRDIDDIFDCLKSHQMDYMHIFGNEGDKEHNHLNPKKEITIGNTEFYSYDSRDFKKTNIYAWNDGTYIGKIKFLQSLFHVPNLPQDVWRLELALKYILEQNEITRWGINKVYFKASNLHGRNVNKQLPPEENLKRFFGELSSWEQIKQVIDPIQVAIVHCGYKPYLEENIRVTGKNNEIILIGDSSVEHLKQLPNVTFVDINHYVNNQQIIHYQNHFQNYSSNSPNFEFICFLRMFVMHIFMKDSQIDRLFHIDSDNVLLYDINKYPFKNDCAYVCNQSHENPLRMSHSIHCGLISKKMCEQFEQLYTDIYINKTKMNLINDKIKKHLNSNNIFVGGGICDMTFYYLLKCENMIDVQNLLEPVTIDNETYVFTNTLSSGEGWQSRNQYNSYCLENIIHDNINNIDYRVFNIHFQGGDKRLLTKDTMNKLQF